MIYNFRKEINTKIVSVWGIILLLCLFFNFWVIPSVLVSSVKALSYSCGKTYPIEKIWSGNWFCPKNE